MEFYRAIKKSIVYLFCLVVNGIYGQKMVEIVDLSPPFSINDKSLASSYVNKISNDTFIGDISLKTFSMFNINPTLESIKYKAVKVGNKIFVSVLRSAGKIQNDTTFQIDHNKSTYVKVYIKTNDSYFEILLEFKFDNGRNDYLCFIPRIYKKIIIPNNSISNDTILLYLPLLKNPELYLKTSKFYLNEYVISNQRHISIDSIDLKKRNAYYSSKLLSDKITGNRVGNFIIDSLKSVISSFEIQKRNARKYYLLNFYGYWCEPCREHLESLIKLESQLIFNSNISMLNIQCVIDKYKLNDEKFKSSSNLAYKNNFEEKIITKNENGLIKYFNIWQYPSWIILDQNGRIIIKDITSLSQLIIELQKLNIGIN